MVFRKSVRYRFGDIDDAGIGYYPTLLHYFHCCFEDWWSDALGTPYPTVLHEEKLGFPAVNLDVDFLSPVRYGDEPEICLTIVKLGTTSVQFGIWMENEGRVMCRARITTVAVDMDTMAKRELPESWRKRLTPLVDPDAYPA